MACISLRKSPRIACISLRQSPRRVAVSVFSSARISAISCRRIRMSCLVARVSLAPAISISMACTMARACGAGTLAFSRISSEAACTGIHHSPEVREVRPYQSSARRHILQKSPYRVDLRQGTRLRDGLVSPALKIQQRLADPSHEMLGVGAVDEEQRLTGTHRERKHWHVGEATAMRFARARHGRGAAEAAEELGEPLAGAAQHLEPAAQIHEAPV